MYWLDRWPVRERRDPLMTLDLVFRPRTICIGSQSVSACMIVCGSELQFISVSWNVTHDNKRGQAHTPDDECSVLRSHCFQCSLLDRLSDRGLLAPKAVDSWQDVSDNPVESSLTCELKVTI